MIPTFQLGGVGRAGAVATPLVHDPDFASVSLLLNCLGANNGTSFPDLSSNGFTPTTQHANVKTVTSDQRFSDGSCASMPTNFPALQYAGHSQFLMTGDFTFEASYKLTSRNSLDFFRLGTEASGRCAFYTGASGDVRFNKFGVAEQIVNSGTGGSSVVPLNAWFDFSVVRSGTTITYRIGTTSIGTTTLSGTMGNGTGEIIIPGTTATALLMANIRVTKGVARSIAALSQNFPTS